MYLVQVTPPTIEPVTYGELIDYLRIQPVDENVDTGIIDLMNMMIRAARMQVETVCNRALITQTWDYSINGWPAEDYYRLPFGNLSSSSLSVKWKGETGTETTLTVTTDYLVETNGPDCGRIVLPYGDTWPTGTLYPSNPITTRFICGYGATEDSVPEEIRMAILSIVSDLWEIRGTLTDAPFNYKVSPVMDRLLYPHKIFWNL